MYDVRQALFDFFIMGIRAFVGGIILAFLWSLGINLDLINQRTAMFIEIVLSFFAVLSGFGIMAFIGWIICVVKDGFDWLCKRITNHETN